MGKAAANLKKPILFAPAPAADAPDANAPIIGAAPANLKKPAAVTENIFGGAVEFAAANDTKTGCPCQKALPEKFRYDAELRDPEAAPAAPACPCATPAPAPKPEDALPPVIAKLRKEKPAVAAPAPCAKPVVAAPAVEKVAPSYYPKRAKLAAVAAAAAAAPAPTPVVAAKPATVTPQFYGDSAADRAARRAARKTRVAARKTVRKVAAPKKAAAPKRK